MSAVLASDNSTLAQYRGWFGNAAATLPGADRDWIAKLRSDSFARFESNGIPNQRREAWKYTRLTKLESNGFEPIVSSSRNSSKTPGADDHGAPTVPSPLREASLRAVFLNGRFAEELSSLGAKTPGLSVTSLASYLERPTHDAWFEDAVSRTGETIDSSLVDLNAAFMSEGIVIEVEANEGDTPLVELIFINTLSNSSRMSSPRIVVHVGRHGSLDLVETHSADDETREAARKSRSDTVTNIVTDVILDAHAELSHVKVQDDHARSLHLAANRVRQHTHSRYVHHSLSYGSQLCRYDVEVALRGPNARCELNGLFVTDGRQHVDHHVWVDHLEADCSSSQIFRGILDGRSRGVFNGTVKVHPDAQRTDAHQKSDNLLLSDNAEIDTKPQLEIHADDVKCSHGATVGQLDDNMLFYLKTRGVPDTAARALLTYGFARDVLDTITIAEARRGATSMLLPHLPEDSVLEEVLS